MLSERDRELLALLGRGRSTGQIAAALAVTPNTVRTRVRRVQRKLAVSGRNQVARRARSLGLA
jgi:DNA-binding CsgD family transcriptional regulator